MTESSRSGASRGIASFAALGEPLLDAPGLENAGLSPRTVERWVWFFVLLGLAARSTRYLLRFPLWEDECFLATNYFDRGFLDLLRPLDLHQVAPMFYLWAELAAVKVLGFTEYSLRLLPFLASLASVLLFRHLARQVLQGTALVLAVATFSCSYCGIRYAAEAKPYGVDSFVSLAILALYFAWRRRPAGGRWLWAITLLTPLCLGLSYPAIFVTGAISLAIARDLPVRNSRQEIIAWFAFNGAMVASFLGAYVLAARGQSSAELGFMRDFWRGAMPRWESPWAFAEWLVTVHAGDMLAFPAGGRNFASLLTFGCLVVGLVAIWRTRRWTLITWMFAPAALNLIAASFERYPYGGHIKFSQYLAPTICLTVGLGAATIAAQVARWRVVGRRAVAPALGFCVLVAVGTMARDFSHPYKTIDDQRARDFARWFWVSISYEGEVVCLDTDLGMTFAPNVLAELNWGATYFCNQRIYSPRHASGQPPRFDLASAERPLSFVNYWPQNFVVDGAAEKAWLDKMSQDFELISKDRLPATRFDRAGVNSISDDLVVVYRFIPRADSSISGHAPGEIMAAGPPDEEKRR